MEVLGRWSSILQERQLFVTSCLHSCTLTFFWSRLNSKSIPLFRKKGRNNADRVDSPECASIHLNGFLLYPVLNLLVTIAADDILKFIFLQNKLRHFIVRTKTTFPICSKLNSKQTNAEKNDTCYHLE